jgi:hypothetical protein
MPDVRTSFQCFSAFYFPKNQQMQLPHQVVDVSAWVINEAEPYNQGARDKFRVRVPVNTEYSFLVPGHEYLFKKPMRRGCGALHHEQFWSEVVAYHVGLALGIEVPPAFVAYYRNPKTEAIDYGSLIEWYYHYPHDDPFIKLRTGGDLLSQLHQDYDVEKGHQHNIESVLSIATQCEVPEPEQTWAAVLLLDSLIGNTDRHHDNWKIAKYQQKGRHPYYRLSPAYDNGTSLGYELDAQALTTKNITAYLNKGKHHMGWAMQPKAWRRIQHSDMLVRLASTHPELQPWLYGRLSRPLASVYTAIDSFHQFVLDDTMYQLCEARACFMVNVIQARHAQLCQALDS